MSLILPKSQAKTVADMMHAEVFSWGRGEYGRLGLGDSSSSSKLRATRVSGLEGHKVVQASGGGTHSMGEPHIIFVDFLGHQEVQGKNCRPKS